MKRNDRSEVRPNKQVASEQWCATIIIIMSKLIDPAVRQVRQDKKHKARNTTIKKQSKREEARDKCQMGRGKRYFQVGKRQVTRNNS